MDIDIQDAENTVPLIKLEKFIFSDSGKLPCLPLKEDTRGFLHAWGWQPTMGLMYIANYIVGSLPVTNAKLVLKHQCCFRLARGGFVVDSSIGHFVVDHPVLLCVAQYT